MLLWLWLWCGPAALALIGPIDWESPYATGAAQKNKKQTKKNQVPFRAVGPAANNLTWPFLSGNSSPKNSTGLRWGKTRLEK